MFAVIVGDESSVNRIILCGSLERACEVYEKITGEKSRGLQSYCCNRALDYWQIVKTETAE